MKKKCLIISTVVVGFLLATPAWAQGVNDKSRPSNQGLPLPKLDTAPPNTNDRSGLEQTPAQQDMERKVLGGIMLGAGVPLFLYGLSQLNKREGFSGNGRDVAAHRAGSQIFGGLGMAAQGTALLLKDGQASKRRAHLAPQHFNTTLPLLQKEALRARGARNTKAILWAVGGILTGAAIGAIPVSDRTVDRRALILTGLGVAGAGITTGIVTYATDSTEEKIFKEAVTEHNKRAFFLKASQKKQTTETKTPR